MSGTPAPVGAGGRLDRTRVTIGAGPFVGPVLSRLLGIHAARACLPVDRVSEAMLIADALSTHAPELSVDDRLSASLRSEQGRLEVRIGPLRAGGAQELLDAAAVPGAGRIVEQLVDDLRIRPSAGGTDTLILRLGA